jgi:tetratricopeptide (TPR) repeat protein
MAAPRGRFDGFIAFAQLGDAAGKLSDSLKYVCAQLLAVLQYFVNFEILQGDHGLAVLLADSPVLVVSTIVLVILFWKRKRPSTVQAGASYSAPLVSNQRARRWLWLLVIVPCSWIIFRYIADRLALIPASAQQILIDYDGDPRKSKLLSIQASQAIERTFEDRNLVPVRIKSIQESKSLESQRADYRLTIHTECDGAGSSGGCSVRWHFDTPYESTRLPVFIHQAEQQERPLSEQLIGMLRIEASIASCSGVGPLSDDIDACYELLRMLAVSQVKPPPQLAYQLLGAMVKMEPYLTKAQPLPLKSPEIKISSRLSEGQRLILEAQQLLGKGELAESLGRINELVALPCQALGEEEEQCRTTRYQAYLKKSELEVRFDSFASFQTLQLIRTSPEAPARIRAEALRRMVALRPDNAISENWVEDLLLASKEEKNSFDTLVMQASLYGIAGAPIEALAYFARAFWSARGPYQRSRTYNLAAQLVPSESLQMLGGGTVRRLYSIFYFFAYHAYPSVETLAHLAEAQIAYQRNIAALNSANRVISVCRKVQEFCPVSYQWKAMAEYRLNKPEEALKTFLSLLDYFEQHKERVRTKEGWKECIRGEFSWYCRNSLNNLGSYLVPRIPKNQ